LTISAARLLLRGWNLWLITREEHRKAWWKMKRAPWPFDAPPGAPVITTTYVTEKRMPILYVSHELDSEGEVFWQFHCGNGDYGPSVLQLVRLDEVLELDSRLTEVANLPLGFCAKRASPKDSWITEKRP
jgi:hypothetical protein